MKPKDHIIAYLIISILLISLGFVKPVSANEPDTDNTIEISESSEDSNESDPDVNSSNTSSLQISPVSLRIGLEPDQEVSRKLIITNKGNSILSLRVYSTPYTLGKESNENDFISETQYTQISKWISFIDSDGESQEELKIELPANQSTEVKYKITVPENAAGGGQYACIFAETQDNNTEASGITTISRAGMIVFASIAGETKKQANIGDINISPMLFKGKIGVTTNVENTGNIDFQASVYMEIKSFFGKQLYNNQLIYTVFPELTRKIYAEWDETPLFGVFRLKTKVTAIGMEVEQNRIILVMPPLMVAFSIVLLVAIIISILYYVQRKKAHDAGDQMNSQTI